MRLKESDLGRRVVACAKARIAPVAYKSLIELLKKASRKLKAYNRLETRYRKEGKDFPKPLGDIPARFLEREKRRRIFTSADECSLKDNSFDHEKEVRIVIILGEEACNERILELQEVIDKGPEHQEVIKTVLRSLGNIKTFQPPEREFIDCPENFIETVAIDPRCPAHKEKFIRNWFEGHGVEVVKSNCFGYLSKLFDVYPSR
jgi:hypothetical protein